MRFPENRSTSEIVEQVENQNETTAPDTYEQFFIEIDSVDLLFAINESETTINADCREKQANETNSSVAAPDQNFSTSTDYELTSQDLVCAAIEAERKINADVQEKQAKEASNFVPGADQNSLISTNFELTSQDLFCATIEAERKYEAALGLIELQTTKDL